MKTLSLILALLFAMPALAHEGHDDAPGEAVATPVGEPVTLSETVIKNLGIETAPATLAPLGKSIDLVASVEYLPERTASVTPRANGSISSLKVKLGDKVAKGQAVATFQPVFVGNPAVTLFAPIGGYVTQLNVTLGQAITPETNVMQIADTSSVLVKGTAYAGADIEAIQIGQKARFTASGASQSLTGTVQRLSKSLEAENRSFAVYALIEGTNQPLLANTSGTLSVQLGDAGEALTVPTKAVLGELGDYFLFVREGNQFERRAVVLGQKSGDRVEIVEGVLPEEQVVTVGNYQLQYAKPSAPAAKAESEDGHGHAH